MTGVVEELVIRLDINAELRAARRPMTDVDVRHTLALTKAARGRVDTDPGEAGAAEEDRRPTRLQRSGGAR